MKVEVHYLFSKNKKIGSYLIRTITRSLCNIKYDRVPSHVAILVNKRWVHESTLDSGVRIISYREWLSHNTEIRRIPAKNQLEYKDIKKEFKNIKSKKYDWLGAIYFGLCILKYILLKKPIPSNNKWNNQDKYFCTEVLGKLLQQDLSMTAPVQIMDNLIKNGKN